jgi:ABC-type amino acid transport substrate-binding protein
LKFCLTAFTALCASLALAACGSDSKSSEESEATATPAEAVERIGNVRTGLDQALAKYKAGDEKAADRVVGDTYLEEFEHVEGPLEKANHELNEELEDGIREELREKIKAGASVQEVETLVDDLKTKLDKAEAALQ